MSSEIEVKSRLENEKNIVTDLEQGFEIKEEEEPSRKTKVIYISGIVIVSLLALYQILFFSAYFFQDKLLYHPNIFDLNERPLSVPEEPFGSLIEDESLYLSRSGGWRVVNLTTKDGVSLHNYWLHANNIQQSASSPVPTTILYLHPNADRIVI